MNYVANTEKDVQSGDLKLGVDSLRYLDWQLPIYKATWSFRTSCRHHARHMKRYILMRLGPKSEPSAID